MDEVDNIIIQSLDQIGCEINKTESISKVTPEALVKIVSKCLSLIKPEMDIPKSLPNVAHSQMVAQRFAVTTKLAELCASIGFKGIGYQTFLYSNITEVRRLLMFLIEKLPRVQHSSNESIFDQKDEIRILKNSILENFKIQHNKPWTSEFCKIAKSNPIKYYLLKDSYKKHILEEFRKDETNENNSESLSKIFQYIDFNNLIPTLIHVNEIQLLKDETIPEINLKNSNVKQIIEHSSSSTTFKTIHTLESSVTSTSSENDNISSINPTSIPLLVIYQSDIEKLKEKIREDISIINNLTEKSQEKKNIISNEIKNLITLKDKKKIHERIELLLDNPEVNLIKMETVLNATVEKKRTYEQQWEHHKNDLILHINTVNGKFSTENQHLEQISHNIISTQQQIQDISKDFKIKKKVYTQLITEMNAENTKADRKVYTSRILEIIGNIFKQKKDIDNILKDTRELQKTINNLTGQLDRQFAVTDDLIYKKAKCDEPSRKCYKLLAILHTTYEQLLDLVKDTGSILREVRDIEDQIEVLKSKNISANLENITRDLEQMIIEKKILLNT